MGLAFYKSVQTQDIPLVWQALYPPSHLGSPQGRGIRMPHVLTLTSKTHGKEETQPPEKGSRGNGHWPGRQGRQLLAKTEDWQVGFLTLEQPTPPGG